MTATESRPVWILGSGRSGQAAAALAVLEGRTVRIFDQSSSETLPAVDGGAEVDWIVSPGFPIEHPWCEAVRDAGGTLVPELEFGASRLEGPVLAITGSLGKTSMVLFVQHLLKGLGFKTTVSGNIGTAVSDTACRDRQADLHVIEASSFQLEALCSFAPDRAVCLNLFPNHLDRHGDMVTYADAKARLFENMKPEGLAVWPKEYPVEVSTSAQRVFSETVELPLCAGTVFERGPLRDNLRMVLAALSGLSGITPDAVEDAVRSFVFPHHRLEVLDVPGVGRVIDDSKSTCFSASEAALASIPGKVHFIMGGIDKDEDPEPMRVYLEERNPVLYLFGRSGKKMREAWKDSVDECLLADSLEDVISMLVKTRTSTDEPIVLSPGCASFDQFDGFEARGDHFQSLIRNLSLTHPF